MIELLGTSHNPLHYFNRHGASSSISEGVNTLFFYGLVGPISPINPITDLLLAGGSEVISRVYFVLILAI